MQDIKFIDENGKEITVSVIGFFRVDELEKEFIMYSLTDDDSSNDMGYVLLGEVVRYDGIVQILGIESEERDMVLAYYNEISNQIGGSENE